MSVLFDVILALILAICAFIGYKHGLLRSLSKFISYLISFTIANKLYTWIAKLLLLFPFLEDMLSGEPFAESMTFLDRFTYCVELIRDNIMFQGEEAEMAAASVIVNHSAAVLISSSVAFILTFIITVVLMKLILFFLDGAISKVPVLSQVNGIFGAIFGLFNGFFWTWLVTNAFVRFLLPTLIVKFPNIFVTEIQNSIIVQFCTKINPLTYILGLINFIFN